MKTSVEPRCFFITDVIAFPKTCVSSHVQTTMLLLLHTIRQLIARQQMRVVSTLSRVKFFFYLLLFFDSIYYVCTVQRFRTYHLIIRSFLLLLLLLFRTCRNFLTTEGPPRRFSLRCITGTFNSVTYTYII